MIANYHTHTPRCNHAWGTEAEYVEKALEAGLKLLGIDPDAPPKRAKPEKLKKELVRRPES